MNGVLPPPPLNIQPRGLLDFFGIKNGGRFPQQLTPDLIPVVDLLTWYGMTNSIAFESQLVTINASTPGTNHPITSTGPVDWTTGGNLVVPNDEVWLLLECRSRWNLSAHSGSLTDWALTIDTPNAAIFHLPMTDYVGWKDSVAAFSRAGMRAMFQPHLILPGTIFYLTSFGTTIGAGGNVTAVADFRVCKMKI